MKGFYILFLFLLINCTKEETVYAPVGSKAEKSEIQISQERARNINEIERRLMEEWMKNQPKKFFALPLNYWIDKENFEERNNNPDDLIISYKYTMSDFDGHLVYKSPKGFQEIPVGKVTDLKAVQNALQKMKIGEEAQLLVPSALAFGTYGDGNKIGSDIPLIINLKIIKSHDKK
jgi:FKBP-type peptidyl-prolyl cis-trans isomerase